VEGGQGRRADRQEGGRAKLLRNGCAFRLVLESSWVWDGCCPVLSGLGRRGWACWCERGGSEKAGGRERKGGCLERVLACLLDSRTEKESCSQTQRIATRRGAISVGGAGGLSLVASGWGQSQDLRESEASSLACPCAVRLSRLAGSTRALKLKRKRKPEPESLALFWRTAKLQHDGRMVVSRLAAPKAVRKPP